MMTVQIWNLKYTLNQYSGSIVTHLSSTCLLIFLLLIRDITQK